jgi:YidC/Oxa1 family membrane protein insertase
MLNNLLLIVFPNGSGIEGFVYWVLSGIMSWGWVSYGVAIMFFTLFIKLIMSPLDFLNRYFTKKNQVVMQKLAPEEARLKEIYASDPMALNKARQELYRKNGGGQSGFCLVMIINLVITLIVFFQVFAALGAISNANIKQQAVGLHEYYAEHSTDANFEEEINKVYNDNNTSFLWVKNIWRPDNWSGQTMSWEEYKNANGFTNDDNKAEYTAIFDAVNPQHEGWNGILLLVLIAGAATYGSTALSTYVNNKNAPKKEVIVKKEPIISYSLRDSKSQNAEQPNVDPAKVGKVMQYIMPVIMISFALTSTAAMAIYIISSSVISTVLTLGLGYLVNLIIKHQKPRADKGSIDPTIINPHAKYFKGERK